MSGAKEQAAKETHAKLDQARRSRARAHSLDDDVSRRSRSARRRARAPGIARATRSPLARAARRARRPGATLFTLFRKGPSSSLTFCVQAAAGAQQAKESAQEGAAKVGEKSQGMGEVRAGHSHHRRRCLPFLRLLTYPLFFPCLAAQAMKQKASDAAEAVKGAAAGAAEKMGMGGTASDIKH